MDSQSTDGIRADMVEEAVRVAEEAERRDVALRLLGGVAIKVRARDGLHSAFEREYADLDWITPKGNSAKAQKFFESLGYAPQTRFNAIHGRERLLYFDEAHDRQVDVLVGNFRMCHEIPFGSRMSLEPLTVPLAELLLTKLQIIELNEKDVRDALAILHDHPVDEQDGDSGVPSRPTWKPWKAIWSATTFPQRARSASMSAYSRCWSASRRSRSHSAGRCGRR